MAWSANDVPIGSYSKRTEAFSAISDYHRNQ
jgi:hypothetical protein